MEKLKILYEKVINGKWQVIVLMIFICLYGSAFGKENTDENLVEKRKTVTYSYSINASDKISLDNQFGDIMVQIWDKNEIKVEITITATANTEARAVDYINSVEVTAKKTDGQVSIKTFIDNDNFGSNWSWNRKGDDEQKKGLKVDYQVFMPKSNALHVKNSFGNITLPDFTAVLDVNQNYGTFTAEDLTNAQNDIYVQFGKAIIKTMKSGKVNMSYSNLSLDKVDDLYLHNSFGKINVKEVNKLDGKISYSDGLIGLVKESARIRVEFSGGFKIGSVAKSVDNIDINSSYSSVVLPLEDGGNYDFDVKVSYGGFDYPQGTTFTRNSEEDEKKDKHNYGFHPTKYYTGKIGKGGGKIIIISSFGGVKIK
jgi:hypothetical protein